MRGIFTVAIWMAISFAIGSAVYVMVPVCTWFSDGNEGWVVVAISGFAGVANTLLHGAVKDFASGAPKYLNAYYRDRYFRIMRMERQKLDRLWWVTFCLAFINVLLGLMIRFGSSGFDRHLFSAGISFSVILLFLAVWCRFLISRYHDFRAEADRREQQQARRLEFLAKK